MPRLSLRLIVFIFCLCLPLSLGYAEDVLELLTNESDQKKQGTSDYSRSSIQDRLKSIAEELKQERATKQPTKFTSRSKKLRTLKKKYSQTLWDGELRKEPRILKMRRAIARLAQRSLEQIATIQSHYNAHIDNLISLEKTFKRYLQTQGSFLKLIQERYSIQNHLALKKKIHQIQGKLNERKRDIRSANRSLNQINQESEESRRQLARIREQMLKSSLERSRKKIKRVKKQINRSKRSKRTASTRPSTQPTLKKTASLSPKKKPLYLVRQRRELAKLAAILQLMRYNYQREHNLLLEKQREDELLRKESSQMHIHLYSELLRDLRKSYAKLRSKLEGGLFHIDPITLDKALVGKLVKHTKKLYQEGPAAFQRSWQKMWKQVSNVQQQTGWLAFLLMSFAPFLLFLLTRLQSSQRLVSNVVVRLEERSRSSSVLRRIWLASLFLVRLLERMIPYAAFWLALTLFLWSLNLPRVWFLVPQLIFGLLIVLRGVWSVTEQLFSPDPNQRMLPLLNDDQSARIRVFIRKYAIVAFLYFPFVTALQLLQYPNDFVAALFSIYFGFLLFGLLRSYLRGETLLTLLEKNQQGIKRLLLYRLYPAFLFSLVLAFACFLWGYRNFSFYAIRGLLLSGLLFFLAFQIFELSTLIYLWMFNLSKEEKGLIQVPRALGLQFVRSARMLTGTLLTLLCIGLLLHIWQVGSFRTLWSLLNKPFLNVQKANLSFFSFVQFFAVFGSAFWLSKFVQTQLQRYLFPLLRLEAGSRYAASTLIGYLLVAFGFLLGMQSIGIGIGVFAVFAGVLGIGIGFGLQNIANNFISGLLIIFGRPISVGDVIEVGSVTGVVRQISIRSTTLETIDRQVILIPNADIITSKLINWSLGPPYVVVRMEVGVAYGSDIPLVEKTLLEVGSQHPSVLQDPPPSIRFNAFGSSSLDFQLLVAIEHPITKWKLLSELRLETNKRFEEEGIEISFPQHDIHFDKEVHDAFRAFGESLQGKTTSILSPTGTMVSAKPEPASESPHGNTELILSPTPVKRRPSHTPLEREGMEPPEEENRSPITQSEDRNLEAELLLENTVDTSIDTDEDMINRLEEEYNVELSAAPSENDDDSDDSDDSPAAEKETENSEENQE